MIRQIIHIDEELCNGCGACASACHEGAIDMVDGKAKLMREHYCDGLGDCLPACPTGAITFEEREAPAYDEAAVLQAKAAASQTGATAQTGKAVSQAGGATAPQTGAGGCPGSRAQMIARKQTASAGTGEPVSSQLSQWPVQIKLVPTKAPYFDGAKLLIAADCTAYAYGDFHNKFIRDHVTLIGCPKLDEGDYSEKLREIIANNDIKSVTIVRMEVPCCGGLEHAAKQALQASGKFIPWRVAVVGIDGSLTED